MLELLLITTACSHSNLGKNCSISVSGMKMTIMGHGAQLMWTKVVFIRPAPETGDTVARNVPMLINLKKV